MIVPGSGAPEPSAYDKLLRVAASVERAKFALGLKGFFDPAQTEIGGLIDEVLADVPFVDQSQPVWWREPGEATVERAARAGYEALSSSAGIAAGTWDDVPESGKAGYRAAAKAILALGK
jgi:hypothetical protein